ncbi:hypothetical protein SAMN04488589_1000 [Methanolobus vulcani]|jgi:ssDNA-binding Zn-finger/Zn-ribbon topoisomerase 1|uniref:Uncharacterized protein n=1 Tax=Methanolobus vulcani TaxID=38026 RepID=A0A7Z7FC34_9EURY|nr:hypothetical protein [Methanolobus vulcani]MDK2825410.1 hypothetical protein [Methanolobus sp.]SDF64541.1 hypothetical protein SAMN04488589_1000 [Methanolobus vulcani]
MSDVNVFYIKENMDVNDDGTTIVTCPECESEISVPISNVLDDSMALAECIDCPVCNKTLDQVHPSENLNKKIADHVAKELLKGLELDLGKVLSKR